MFIIAGGASRYLTGFTRVKNAEIIKNKLAQNDSFKDIVDVPRKWYWQPENNKWFDVRGLNFKENESLHTSLPSMYGVVADYIDKEASFSIFNTQQRSQAMKIAHAVAPRLDPNISNFMIERNTKKVIISDTEHFPSIIGMREPLQYHSYPSLWKGLETVRKFMTC